MQVVDTSIAQIRKPLRIMNSTFKFRLPIRSYAKGVRVPFLATSFVSDLRQTHEHYLRQRFNSLLIISHSSPLMDSLRMNSKT